MRGKIRQDLEEQGSVGLDFGNCEDGDEDEDEEKEEEEEEDEDEDEEEEEEEDENEEEEEEEEGEEEGEEEEGEEEKEEEEEVGEDGVGGVWQRPVVTVRRSREGRVAVTFPPNRLCTCARRAVEAVPRLLVLRGLVRRRRYLEGTRLIGRLMTLI